MGENDDSKSDGEQNCHHGEQCCSKKYEQCCSKKYIVKIRCVDDDTCHTKCETGPTGPMDPWVI